MSQALQWLFPDERKFFARFADVASRVDVAARVLEQAFDVPTRFPDALKGIERVNREAKSAAHQIDLGADRMFVPPMGREDVHALSVRLTRMADHIGGTARRAVSLRLTERREAAVALSRILVTAVREIATAMSHLREAEAVLRHCLAIKQAEEEGDAAWQQAVTDLFQGDPDPLQVLRWKTVYDQLEEALDACEDVANELETITVKHG